MSLPRFLDADDGFIPVDPCLFCSKCGYAIAESVITENWVDCPLCKQRGKQGKLEHRLNRYPGVSKVNKSRR